VIQTIKRQALFAARAGRRHARCQHRQQRQGREQADQLRHRDRDGLIAEQRSDVTRHPGQRHEDGERRERRGEHRQRHFAGAFGGGARRMRAVAANDECCRGR
jgi:hypothetical protein